MKFPYLHLQLWDRDIVKWNDCAGVIEMMMVMLVVMMLMMMIEMMVVMPMMMIVMMISRLYLFNQLYRRHLTTVHITGEGAIDLGRFYRKAYKRNVAIKLFETKKGGVAKRAQKREKLR